MKNLEILKVKTITEIKVVSELAGVIWHEYFTPIIGIAQVEYMINKFQCSDAIAEQINNGYEYYLFYFKEEFVGYTGIKKEGDRLFLSKLYIKKEFRGNKIAKESINFMVKLANTQGLDKIWLTVNKNNNNTIAAYEKMGFVKTKMQKSDIGNGFFMDDYIMEKAIILNGRDIK